MGGVSDGRCDGGWALSREAWAAAQRQSSAARAKCCARVCGYTVLVLWAHWEGKMVRGRAGGRLK